MLVEASPEALGPVLGRRLRQARGSADQDGRGTVNLGVGGTRVRIVFDEPMEGCVRPWFDASSAALIASTKARCPISIRPKLRATSIFVQVEDPETAVARIIELVKTRIPKRFGLDPIRASKCYAR